MSVGGADGALEHLAERVRHWRAGSVEPWPALRALGAAFVGSPGALARLAPPAVVVERWERQRRATRARNVVVLDELARALRVLEDAGVESIVLKGAAAVEQLYPDLGWRPMDDADLLVRPEDRAAAKWALGAAGFEPVEIDPGRLGPVAPGLHAAQAYRRGEGALVGEIDLHWQPVSDARLRAAFPGAGDEGVWTRAERYETGGARARRLGRLDAALLTATAQMLGHPWSHPLGYLDLHLLVGGLDADGWRDLVARARRQGLGAPLYWSLRFTRELFGTPGAEVAVAALRPGPATRRLGEWLVRGDWLGLAPFRREQPQRDLFVLAAAGPGVALRLARASLAEREGGAPRGARLDPRASLRTAWWLLQSALLTLAERPTRA